MRPLNTFTTLQQIPSAFLNDFQDETMGARVADGNTEFAATTLGADTIITQTSALILNDNLAQLDASVSWLDRLVVVNGWLFTVNQRVGQTNDYELNDPTASVRTIMAQGYTGTGALSDTTTGAVVSATNPPVNGVAAFRSYAPVLYRASSGVSTYESVWLYAVPSTGELAIYNGTGTPLYFTGVIYGFAPTGLR